MKNTAKIIPLLITVFSMVVFLMSCAAPKKKDVMLVWPLPPEETKIKWVGWIHGTQDVKKKSSEQKFLDTLIGEKDQDIRFVKPYGVHASKGRLYVSDSAMGTVFVLDFKEGKFFNLGGSGAGILSKPFGIATDSEGNIYVADAVQNRVVAYKNDGTYLRSFGDKDRFEQPVGVAVSDAQEKVYVLDTKKHEVHVFSKQGDFLFKFGKRGGDDGDFNFPTNIFVDKEGSVYVSDTLNFRVQIFDAQGKFLSKFGKIGDVQGQFTRPRGLAVDSEGHIYVSDAAFNNVQIFDKEGKILLFFGEMGVAAGQFYQPAGLSIDEEDKIYVADQFNKRINVFQYVGGKPKTEPK
jgi:DNA-binding beta-propeller fold protein YncE